MSSDTEAANEDKIIIDKIHKIKSKLGKQLLILTHHYQRKEIVDIGDYKGDSLGLARKAAEDPYALFIVFCGVHFMAESAAILAKSNQTVQIPDMEAGCWMADMIDGYMLEKAWKDITSVMKSASMIPIVYVNSDADIKAFCGRHNGSTCTSSNAEKVLKWGFEQGDKILFIPDQHLGRNTGNRLGIPSDQMITWNPELESGGNTAEAIRNASLILWDGHCLVHTRFLAEHIRDARSKYPHARIVVHPECTEDVVQLADAVGSTSFIVDFVKNASSNEIIIIGTEFNLIHRLALENPDKKIMPLHRSLCPNMNKINLHNLLYTLENIGQVNCVKVDVAVKGETKLALDRMLCI